MTAGIHWHMNIANEVTYAHTDKQRQEIPWVRVTDTKTGEQHRVSLGLGDGRNAIGDVELCADEVLPLKQLCCRGE